MKYVTIINDEQFEIEIDKNGGILLNGEPRNVDFLTLGPSLYSVITDDRSLEVVIEEAEGVHQVLLGGRMYDAQVLDERALLMVQRRGGLGSSSGEVPAPMPGLIVKVTCEVGQQVAKGDTVVILESMKMQNELKAPIDGIVETIHCQAGQTVDKNTTLIVIVSPDEDDD